VQFVAHGWGWAVSRRRWRPQAMIHPSRRTRLGLTGRLEGRRTVDQELLLRNEYLGTENRLLRKQLPGRVRLSDGERQSLAEIGKKLGTQALQEVATIVIPDTILAWHRKLVTQKFDGSRQRKAPGRPRGGHSGRSRHSTTFRFQRGGTRAVAQTADATGLGTMHSQEFSDFELFEHTG
jgi:hypothetical protein